MYLVAIEGSNDRSITELVPFLSSDSTRKNWGIPAESFNILESGIELVSTIPALKLFCKSEIRNSSASRHNQHLQKLSVQNKFPNVIELQEKERVLSHIMRLGLPQGQLSFLLKASSDTLPTPLNLKRMKFNATVVVLCAATQDQQQLTF